MKPEPIRTDEWLAELARLERESQSAAISGGVAGFTTDEYAKHKKIAKSEASKRIAAWIDEGILRCSGRAIRRGRAGQITRPPAYVVVKPNRKNKQ